MKLRDQQKSAPSLADMEEMRKTVSDTLEQKAAAERQAESARKAASALEAEINDLTTKVEKQQAEVLEAKRECREVKRELESASSNLVYERTAASEAQEEFSKRMEAERLAFKCRVDTLEARLEAFVKELEETRRERDDLLIQREREASRLAQSINEREQACRERDAALSEMGSCKETAKSLIQAEAEVRRLEVSLAVTEEALRSRHVEECMRLEGLENLSRATLEAVSIHHLTNSFAVRLLETVGSHELDAVGKDRALIAKEKEIVELRTEAASKEARLASKQTEVDALQHSVAGLREDVSKMESLVVDTQQGMRDTVAAIESIQSKARAIEVSRLLASAEVDEAHERFVIESLADAAIQYLIAPTIASTARLAHAMSLEKHEHTREIERTQQEAVREISMNIERARSVGEEQAASVRVAEESIQKVKHEHSRALAVVFQRMQGVLLLMESAEEDSRTGMEALESFAHSRIRSHYSSELSLIRKYTASIFILEQSKLKWEELGRRDQLTVKEMHERQLKLWRPLSQVALWGEASSANRLKDRIAEIEAHNERLLLRQRAHDRSVQGVSEGGRRLRYALESREAIHRTEIHNLQRTIDRLSRRRVEDMGLVGGFDATSQLLLAYKPAASSENRNIPGLRLMEDLEEVSREGLEYANLVALRTLHLQTLSVGSLSQLAELY